MTEIKPEGKQVPISFELPYDPKLINTRHRYAIQVKIREGSSVRFITTKSYPVITLGNPQSVNVVVQPIGPR